jgi:heat shock protein HslJ
MQRPFRHRSAALGGLSALFATVVLIGASCTSDAGFESPTTSTGSGGAGGAASIVGPWTLVSYGSGGAQTSAAPEPAALVLADDGRFTGSTGCNNLAGDYTVSGSKLTVSPGPMTKRACIDDAGNAQEQAVLAGLTSAAGFGVDGDRLTITDAGGRTVLVFERGPEGLADTAWTVSGINTGTAVVSSEFIGALNATFATDGTVSGSGGCNTFSGAYTDDNGSVAITDLQSTEIGCEPERATLESQYFAALGRAATYELTPSSLTLRDADGAIQVMFTTAP